MADLYERGALRVESREDTLVIELPSEARPRQRVLALCPGVKDTGQATVELPID